MRIPVPSILSFRCPRQKAMPSQVNPVPLSFGRRLVLGAVATVLLIVLFAVPIVLLLSWVFKDAYHVHTIRVDDTYSIELTAAAFWEVSQPVYFEIYKDGDSLQHRTALGYTNESTRDLDFELLTTPDRSMFAIVERSNPDVVLMFFDAEAGIVWPGNGGPPWDQHDARMNRVLDRLRRHFPERNLILSAEVPGNRPLRIGT